MRTPRGERLYIQEVSVRDGFQIEPAFVPTDVKVALIDRLSATGLAKIEVSSFTSPKAIPMLADAAEVFARIRRVPGVEYTALVPNVRGCERALAADVDEINVVMSSSDAHNLANLRMTSEQSLAVFAEIVEAAKGSRVAINGSLSTALGCPFEGDVPVERVLRYAGRCLDDLGMRGISIADTTGMANPAQVEALFAEVVKRWPQAQVTAHFHDTRGMGLANALAALDAGVVRFDASLAGLGGCPYAPGASGNVTTEDLVHMLDAMGYDTGVDLDLLLAAARSMPGIVGHDVPGQVMKAGPSTTRHPRPAPSDTQTRLAG